MEDEFLIKMKKITKDVQAQINNHEMQQHEVAKQQSKQLKLYSTDQDQQDINIINSLTSFKQNIDQYGKNFSLDLQSSGFEPSELAKRLENALQELLKLAMCKLTTEINKRKELRFAPYDNVWHRHTDESLRRMQADVTTPCEYSSVLKPFVDALDYCEEQLSDEQNSLLIEDSSKKDNNGRCLFDKLQKRHEKFYGTI